MKLTTPRITKPHSEIVEEGFHLAQNQQDESHRYFLLASEFQSLSAALESERLRFKTLKNFRNKAEVKESLERLKKEFQKELAPEADSDQ